MASAKLNVSGCLTAWGAGIAMAVGFIAFMGIHHGWDRHSYLVTVPFWSGPSDDQIKAELAHDGTVEPQVLDRWPGFVNDNDSHARKGTILYPVRVKGIFLVGSKPQILDAYFYKDDFGQLHSYGYQPADKQE